MGTNALAGLFAEAVAEDNEDDHKYEREGLREDI